MGRQPTGQQGGPRKQDNTYETTPAFITKFNHQSRVIGKILIKHWNILRSDSTLTNILDPKPKIIFTKAPNLQLLLTVCQVPIQKGFSPKQTGLPPTLFWEKNQGSNSYFKHLDGKAYRIAYR
ncbi:Hypothetical predicted protein, partial [Pelobates cultripes]